MPRLGPATLWSERIAGLQQPGDSRVEFQDRPQPASEHHNLLAPIERAGGLAVNLGKHPVYHEVTQMILTAHVPVQGAGNHAQSGGEAAHAEGVQTVCADDGEGFSHDPLAGKRATLACIAIWWAEPQLPCVSRGRCLRWDRHFVSRHFDCGHYSLYSEQCTSEANDVH
jgi:hypothetical protein